MALDTYAAKEEELGEESMRQAEKQIMLWAVDNRWVRHLTDLDRLREGIGLQALAQVDPLVAYKRQAFNMYGELMHDITGDIVKAVFQVQVQPAGGRRRPTPIARNIRTHRGTDGSNGQAADRAQHRAAVGSQRPMLVRQRQEVQALPHEERPRQSRRKRCAGG